jgi:hypothetical protein
MSKKLAIQGHSTRGKEVIELLEMMGGVNRWKASGNIEKVYYSISNGAILYSPQIEKDTVIYTLEEFLEKYPFKVGDVIKFPNNMAEEIAKMKWDEELEDIIYTSVSDWTRSCYVPKNTNNKANTNMNENKVESTGFMQIGKTVAVCFNPENYEDEVELQLGNYEIAVRDGKIYAVLKKPKYPTTYGECCEVLVGRKPNPNEISFDKMELCLVDLDNTQSIDFQNPYLSQLNSLFRLLMCRNAYWKIAGEEMGLGKPWEPNWDDEDEYKYGLFRLRNTIYKDSSAINPTLLIFPTEEMRDAFYENFKNLIEQCKELL